MILITGASGLLGAHVLKQALGANQKVAGIANRYEFQLPGAEIYNVDLTDFAASRRIAAGVQPTAIVHCAAATNVDWCDDHPEQAHQLNVCASSSLAQLAQEIGARFVYVSTDSVFDGDRGNYSETDAPCPCNVYARTKLLGEQEVLRIHPSALIVRVNFYGWSMQNKASLAEWILGRLNEGGTVPGFCDVYFCPTLVDDLAEALLRMMDRGMSGIYHVAGSEKISKFEFASRVATRFGFPQERVVPAAIERAGLRASRPRDTSLQTQKVTAALGCALPDVDSGLQRFWALREREQVQRSQIVHAGVER
jgi:dTDP-4-dehydrorhamnose reductase